MFLSKPNFKAEDVISVLNPEYKDDKNDEEVNAIQKDCFERRLPEANKQLSIDTSDSNFLSNFLSFCTGSS